MPSRSAADPKVSPSTPSARPVVLARRRLELLQLKLHLVEEPRLALRAGAVELAPQLLDGELQMRDEGFAARQIRLRVGRLGPCIAESACAVMRAPLGDDHRMGAGKIRGQHFRSGGHHKMESHLPVPVRGHDDLVIAAALAVLAADLAAFHVASDTKAVRR